MCVEILKQLQSYSAFYEFTFFFSFSELFTWDVFTEEEKPNGLYIPPSIHEQPDGTVLAMCITGTASKDSLVMWIRALQRTNPKLKEIPVVFKLKTPETLPDIAEQENSTNLPAL